MTRVRRHWRPLTVTVVLTGLTVNAWVQAGPKVLLVLALAGIGCAVAIVVPSYVGGAVAAKHSTSERRAVEAAAARRAIERLEATARRAGVRS